MTYIKILTEALENINNSLDVALDNLEHKKIEEAKKFIESALILLSLILENKND